MSDKKSLAELKQLVDSLTINKLKTLVNEDDQLSSQLSFTRPEGVVSDDDCELWGKDPDDGWVCLKP